MFTSKAEYAVLHYIFAMSEFQESVASKFDILAAKVVFHHKTSNHFNQIQFSNISNFCLSKPVVPRDLNWLLFFFFFGQSIFFTKTNK